MIYGARYRQSGGEQLTAPPASYSLPAPPGRLLRMTWDRTAGVGTVFVMSGPCRRWGATGVQASDLIECTREHHMHTSIVVSLLLGLRPEEARALRWDRVRMEPEGGLPAHIEVWRSVQFGGDTKTPKSRRTLAFSGYVGTVLGKHRADQDKARQRAGERWHENELVFPSQVGTVQDAHNVLRAFRMRCGWCPGSIRMNGQCGSCATRCGRCWSPARASWTPCFSTS